MSEVAVKDSGNLLPENWVFPQIQEICEVNPRVDKKLIPDDLKVSFVPMPAVEPESGVIDVSEEKLFSEVKKGFTPFQEGDVLFAKITPCMENGKMALVPKVTNDYGFGSTEFHVLRSSNAVDAKYLYYFVSSRTFRGHAQHNMSGAVGQKRVPTNYLKEHRIPLAPPEQQKRIVAKIEELFSHIDAGIVALNKAKQLLKQYRQSVLKAAVTGELTKQWREDNKDKLEPAIQLLERILTERRQKWEEQQLDQFKAKGKVPKDDRWKGKYTEPASMKEWGFLCELPDSWQWASVAEIGDTNDQPVLTGPFGSNLGKKDFIEFGVPVLTIGCLKEARVELKKAMYVSEEKADELERYRLKDGDMLFSRMAAVGRAGHVSEDIEGCLFNYHIMRLRLHSSAISQEYFVHYVRGSTQVYDYVKEVNHGATRDGINTQQLLEMPVALPCLVEQYEICRVVKEKLDSIRRLELEVNNQLVKAEKNKQSILASAFSGTL